MIRNRFFTALLLAAVLSFTFFMLPAQADSSANASEIETKDTVLTGKKIFFTGDSIADAYCERTNGRRDIMFGWVSRIGVRNKMTWITMAQGGASISNCRGENTILNQIKKKQNNSYDFVILHGMVNDAWDSAPLGRISDGFDPEDFSMTTFSGGLEATLHLAKTSFPDATIGFIINFQLPLGGYGRMADMSPYVKIIIRACEKWGVEYLDLYNNEELNAALEVGTSTRYLPDHIHPNTAGYDILYPVIEEWLIELASRPAEPEPSEPESQEPSAEPSVSETAPVPEVSEASPEAAFDPSLIIAVAGGSAVLICALAFILLRKRRSESGR